jgi:hypothetical protein
VVHCDEVHLLNDEFRFFLAEIQPTFPKVSSWTKETN